MFDYMTDNMETLSKDLVGTDAEDLKPHFDRFKKGAQQRSVRRRGKQSPLEAGRTYNTYLRHSEDIRGPIHLPVLTIQRSHFEGKGCFSVCFLHIFMSGRNGYLIPLSLPHRRLRDLSLDGKGTFLIHGDSWANNLLFGAASPGGVKLIDWQYTATANPMLDFGLTAYIGSKPEEVEANMGRKGGSRSKLEGEVFVFRIYQFCRLLYTCI